MALVAEYGTLPLESDGAAQVFDETVFDCLDTIHAHDMAIPRARGGGAPQNPLNFVLPNCIEYWCVYFILPRVRTDVGTILPL